MKISIALGTYVLNTVEESINALYSFEWLVVRIASLVFVGGSVGAFITRKNNNSKEVDTESIGPFFTHQS